MDFDPQSSNISDESLDYREYYYSTGGNYRPPHRPKNYGWMVAVTGVFLLCIAGGVVLNRDNHDIYPEMPEYEQLDIGSESEIIEYQELAAEPEFNNGETIYDEVHCQEIYESPEETLQLQEIYKKVIVSVVSITASSGGSTTTGTGIIMSSDGYIITNCHVISDAQTVTALISSGEEFVATVIGSDETSDLAVMKIDASDLTPAEFGSSDNLEVGDAVVAIGDPLGIELRGTMTDGIICGLSRDVQVEDRTLTLIQTNAALNSGNSGGPLVNMSGQVIGINTMKLSSSYTSVEGIGFAIPISTAKPIVDELIENGYVSGRPAFGFTVEVLSSQMKQFYSLPSVLYICDVETDSDADKQGVQEGDLIIAMNGISVSTLDELNTIKNRYSAGDTVTLTVYRRGIEIDLDVQLMDQAEID